MQRGFSDRVPCHRFPPISPISVIACYCARPNYLAPSKNRENRGQSSWCSAPGRFQRRFTPTRVGNTMRARYRPAAAAVHPHTRGEHAAISKQFLPVSGSPPHAWGTLSLAALNAAMMRFTPTRVGNTVKPLRSPKAYAVHPHTRGEHVFASVIRPSTNGSPPHAWGTQRGTWFRCKRKRFTPTRVGNTGESALAGRDTSVHPHTRGEHGH